MRIERMMRIGIVVLGAAVALPLVAQQGAMTPMPEVTAPLPPASAQVNEAYDAATVALDRGDYARAIELFSEIVNQKGDRADAALYWVAYAQQRQGDGGGAMNTIGVLRREFPESAWLDDADHLVAEIRGARGQVEYCAASRPRPGSGGICAARRRGRRRGHAVVCAQRADARRC